MAQTSGPLNSRWVGRPEKRSTRLELSETAAAALDTIRPNEAVPESHDTRLSAERQPPATSPLGSSCRRVGEEDQVAEQSGTEVYVDPQIADELAASVMDVRDTDQGLAFVFRPQS